MTRKFDDQDAKNSKLAGRDGDAPIQERVEELAWAAMDEVATEDDIRLLDSLLLSDDEAVEGYLGCVQLHVDLMAHFAPDSAVGSEGSKTVLSSLGEGVPPLGMEPHQS
jgi:hypothetical protein